MAEQQADDGSTAHAKHSPASQNNMSSASHTKETIRHGLPDLDTQVSRPSTMPRSNARKRPALSSIDAPEYARLQDNALITPTSGSPMSDSNNNKVCLCQPDPKIPRPRNAFILYRQHHQTSVVSQHRGLSNPEISKIIGEQWRDESDETKAYWKKLAEEEKRRHQNLYPGYRYQPRRTGAPVKPSPSGGPGEGARCPKCHGKYINLPDSPITPAPLTGGSGHRSSLITFPVRDDAPEARFRPKLEDRDMPRTTTVSLPMRESAVDGRVRLPESPYTPRSGPPLSVFRRTIMGEQRIGEPHPATQRLQVIDEDYDQPEFSPEIKRRRFNSIGASSPLPYERTFRRGPMPAYVQEPRSHPNAHLIHHQQQRAGMMEPPPRPSPPYYKDAPSRSSSLYEESVRLPPLQTRSGSLRRGHALSPETSGVEAMIMSIGYMSKVKVLNKISPPLAPAGPTSPRHEVRGPVIAVEGADLNLVAEVGQFIHEHLAKEAEYVVKTFTSPTKGTNNSPRRSISDIEMTGTGTYSTSSSNPTSGTTSRTEATVSTPPSNSNGGFTNPFTAYLETMKFWHEENQNIINFITTAPLPPLRRSSPHTPEGTSPRATDAPPPTPVTATFEHADNADTHQTLPSLLSVSAKTQKLTPIALLPSGFSMTISDEFAVTIPIGDAYAPIDHWQWMATLWRGIVGADLIVYVKPMYVGSPRGTGAGAANEESRRATSVDREAEEELRRCGAVEVRREVGGVWVVVVRVLVRDDGTNDRRGMGSGEGAKPKIEESTLRRLGFEVLEIVRGGVGEKIPSTPAFSRA